MTRSSHARGFTLLEVMVSLSVLTIGLLGMLKLQIIGIGSTNGARMHTVGVELAQELVSGIERLPFGDPLVAVTGTSGPTAPTPFGRLVSGLSVASGANAWTDSTPVPGVRLSTQLPAGYTRRWTVWGYTPTAGALPSVKLVAVSVTWSEPGLIAPREVVLYTQLTDAGALLSNLPANL